MKGFIKSRGFIRGRYAAVVLSSFVALLFAVFLYFDVFEDINYFIDDLVYQRDRELSTDVVIVAIDDESLDVLGRWPWHRSYHGMLLEIIDSGDPKAIGVDLLFMEESDADAEFAESLSKLSKKPIFAGYGVFDESAEQGMISSFIFNMPTELLGKHVNTAHINTIPDSDGILRKTVLKIKNGDKIVESFASAIFREAYRKNAEESSDLQLLPADAFEMAYIRYAGRAGTFEQVPYYMVLTGEVDPEYFRDKVVLVGVTAIGLADDYYFTAIDRTYPMYGIEVHANIIQQMREQLSWVRMPIYLEIAVLLLISAFAIVLFSRLRLFYGAAATFALMAAFVWCAVSLSRLKAGYIFSLLYPLSSVFFVFVVINVVKYVQESLERRRVTNVFGKYMEPRLVDRLLRGGEDALGLGGTKKNISVLFVDIRGFTTMSEKLEPEQVVGILNEYLDLCAEAIFKYDGTLDKYIGDAAMGLFGAPLEIEDHAYSAVQTALHMQSGAEKLSKNLMEKYGRTVSFGVGINTGDAIVGNIGASHRLDYTAIGDAVNTAARLESNAKPGQILISESTYRLVENRVAAAPLGALSVKGKQQSVNVYEVKGLLGKQGINNI